MAKGGYTLENWWELESDLRVMLEEEAVLAREDVFGKYYEVTGILRKGIRVKTIWMLETGTDIVRFITLIPQPKHKDDEI